MPHSTAAVLNHGSPHTQPDEHLRRAQQADRDALTNRLNLIANHLPTSREQHLTNAGLFLAEARAHRAAVATHGQFLAEHLYVRAHNALPTLRDGITVGEYRVLLHTTAREARR